MPSPIALTCGWCILVSLTPLPMLAPYCRYGCFGQRGVKTFQLDLHGVKWRLLVASLLPLLMQGCALLPLRGETIVAVALDNGSHAYSILAVPARGFGKRDLFKGSLAHSYSGIAIRSLAQPMTLRVRQLEGVTFRELLVDFDPASGTFVPSCRSVGPPGDIGVFSPDGSTYAHANAAGEHAAITLITCSPDAATAVSEVVDPGEPATRAWYTSLSWAPSGRKIVGVRLWQEGRHFHSEVRVSLLSGSVTTALPKAEGPIASAFRSDEGIVALAREGIVTVDLGSGRVTTVFPRSGLQGRRYIGGGIAWMPKSQSIAIGLFNPSINAGEIWKIRLADQRTRILYRKKDSLFFNILCIDSQ